MNEPSVTAPRIWAQENYGSQERHFIRPANFRCTELAAELADAWLDVAPELPGGFLDVRSAIHALLRYFDAAIDPPTSLGTLTRAQLDAWELHLLTAG